jgi:hypothetical protein
VHIALGGAGNGRSGSATTKQGKQPRKDSGASSNTTSSSSSDSLLKAGLGFPSLADLPQMVKDGNMSPIVMEFSQAGQCQS